MSTDALRARFDQCYRLAEQMRSGSPMELAIAAAMMAETTERMVNSSPTWQEFLRKVQAVEKSCLDNAPLSKKKEIETILVEFRYRKELFLKQIASGAVPETEYNEQEIAFGAMQESIKEARRVCGQSCETCKTKNYSYLTETGELKHFLKKCSFCKKALYCSIDCQGKDWPRHKSVECLSNRP